ncbi:caspase domain protein [Kordia sp. SMS9]|uniref:caspase family protein n=1 Tax=Kordia sp. SMS9 TaxID=2282170 RepID=UPI000E0CFF66|nr:caspase family protein [Kordia sp. SMS9]AXG72396.1 caspase domain protein [Kordia sp. SMS9]
MPKKALVVGIDYYQEYKNLNGAVNDAYEVKSALERNGDGTRNFGIKLITSSGEDTSVAREELRSQVEALFRDENHHTVLFYFAGHGHLDTLGSFILTSNCKHGNDGISLDEILKLANSSPAKNKIIILDCCHSGNAGSSIDLGNKSILAEGITILTASTEKQFSVEVDGKGVFTTLLVDALNGGAANLLGQITPGSVYAHIDQSLGEWEQRPIFKTNVKSFISLKSVNPAISLEDLKRITELFEEKTFEFELDSTYEHTSEDRIPERSEKFHVLQRYNRVNLVIPVNAAHMYDAAMESKSCKLTVLGQHYWNLVAKNTI